MPASTTAPETIVLHGGCSVPLAALRVLWDLEARGFTISTDGTALIVAPKSAITPADDRAIRHHRDALMALVAYVETM